MMYSVSMISLLFCMSVVAEASSTKVKLVRTKGKMAIVRLLGKDAGDLEPGIYSLNSGAPAQGDLEEESRDYSLSGSLDAGIFQSVTTAGGSSVKADSKAFSSHVTFGWNFVSYEFGPFISYDFSSQGKIDTKTLLFGAFYDFNFVKNREEKLYVPGLRVEIGSGVVDSTAMAKSFGVSQFQVGFFLKYFFLSSQLAVIPELAYKSTSGGPSTAVTKTSGTLARIGVVSYF